MRRSAPTIVTTSVEFWTIEVSRRWIDLRGAQRDGQRLAEDRGQGGAHGAGDVAVELDVTAADVATEQGDHIQR